MSEPTDHELLADYARTGSEAAFAQIVARHINLVHSAARRYTGNEAQAEEITQAVFLILARKAGSLSKSVALAGWLYQTARLTAANALKAETRRQLREQEAYMQTQANEADAAVWREIAPLLDDAMGRLGATDRTVLVLRFFEGRTNAETAAALGLAEGAVQRRVLRALEKLRARFAQQGVTQTAQAIAGTVSAHAVQVAPAGLLLKVSLIAAKGAATTTIATIVKGTLKTMTWTKVKTATIVSLGILLATGTTIAAISRIKTQANKTPIFIAEGLISSEFHQLPPYTNTFIKTDGRVLFAYSNGVWRIQFTYEHQSDSGLPTTPHGQLATMVDEKRIPDGIRKIITIPSVTNLAKPGTILTRPSASVQTNTFPDVGEKNLFLPWLSLCPNPELPLFNSDLIHLNFQPKLFGNPEDRSRFKVNYIEPDHQFLSELVITNSGVAFLSDGNTMDYPEPFNHGFIEFSYKVLETTNSHGITFPRTAMLYQYVPLPNGKSSADTYPATITRLNIQQIDVGGRNLALVPVPASLVALDSRFGLSNRVTVNYEVINDEWYSVTNKRMQQLAKTFGKVWPKNVPVKR